MRNYINLLEDVNSTSNSTLSTTLKNVLDAMPKLINAINGSDLYGDNKEMLTDIEEGLEEIKEMTRELLASIYIALEMDDDS